MTSPRPGTPRRPLPVPAVLALGLLGVAAVMLLLFGPFHGGRYESPGRFLQWWLVNLSGGLADVTGLRAAQRLASRLLYGYIPLLILVLVLLMAVLPAAVAFVRRSRDRGGDRGKGSSGALLGAGASGAGISGTGSRGRGSRGGAARESAPRRDSRSSLVFSDDGSIGEVGAAPGQGLERGIGELQVLAVEAGLPWHSRFETEGGARAFLEILRARGEGPATVRRAEEPAPGREPAHRVLDGTTGDEADGPSPQGGAERAHAAGPNSPGRSAFAAGGTRGPSDPEGSDRAADVDEGRTAWTPGGVASVYTPTTLYSSAQGSDGTTQAADESGEEPQEEGR